MKTCFVERWIMKKILSALSLLITLSVAVSAQEDFSTLSFSRLKGDYQQVRVVAHVKINSIELAAADVHPLYVVRSVVLEPFKGRLRRGQPLEFYFHAEEDFNVKQLVDRDWIIFLEGKHPIPPGGAGWYELENSTVLPTKPNLAKLRRIKYSKQGSRKR